MKLRQYNRHFFTTMRLTIVVCYKRGFSTILFLVLSLLSTVSFAVQPFKDVVTPNMHCYKISFGYQTTYPYNHCDNNDLNTSTYEFNTGSCDVWDMFVRFDMDNVQSTGTLDIVEADVLASSDFPHISYDKTIARDPNGIWVKASKASGSGTESCGGVVHQFTRVVSGAGKEHNLFVIRDFEPVTCVLSSGNEQHEYERLQFFFSEDCSSSGSECYKYNYTPTTSSSKTSGYRGDCSNSTGGWSPGVAVMKKVSCSVDY